jgi:hypothetical protein
MTQLNEQESNVVLQGAAMNTADLGPTDRSVHGAPTAGARLAHRPSFANALRQRGLLAKAAMPGSIAGAWAGGSGTWLAVSSIYEAHLHRVLMEQALETLRGDAAG